MKLQSNQITALKRKRGENNLTINELAKEIGVSRFTMSRIINDDSQKLTSTTVNKVNNWLINQYNQDMTKEVKQ